MNVLSLFDGISCGQLALSRASVAVDKYYASEIDHFAMKVTYKNFPNTIQLGDIKNWKESPIDLVNIDLILAGFPCQAWSIAGNKNGKDDPRGALVYDLLDIFTVVKNKNSNVKFLFENVLMSKVHLDYLNDLFKVEPVEIDSGLLSAQTRRRLYWTNIKDINLPIDKRINLSDILEGSAEFEWVDKERSDYVIKLASLPNKVRKEVVKEGAPLPNDIHIRPAVGQHIYNNHLGQNGTLFKDKSATLVCAGQAHCIGVIDNCLRIRRLTITELERLQTLPEGYTAGISTTQRRKAIGNGWTVDVIAHILKGLK